MNRNDSGGKLILFALDLVDNGTANRRRFLLQCTLKDVELEATREERDTARRDVRDTHLAKDEIIRRAWEVRDQAVARKNAAEIELARTRIDVLQINSQLLEAIQQKVELSQQLDQWQVWLCFRTQGYSAAISISSASGFISGGHATTPRRPDEAQTEQTRTPAPDGPARPAAAWKRYLLLIPAAKKNDIQQVPRTLPAVLNPFLLIMKKKPLSISIIIIVIYCNHAETYTLK